MASTIAHQILLLFVYAIPVACIAWTVTHEEVFREPREYCVDRSRHCSNIWQRKFFYLFTCEYCFSHYVTIFMLMVTGYQLVFNDWRGYFLGGFSLVWVANIYMSLFGRIRIDLKSERLDTKLKENTLKKENGSSQPEEEQAE